MINRELSCSVEKVCTITRKQSLRVPPNRRVWEDMQKVMAEVGLEMPKGK